MQKPPPKNAKFPLSVEVRCSKTSLLKLKLFNIQLFRERLSEKNVHATIPNGNMGYDHYTVPDDCSCRTCLCCFPLALADICPWSLVPFFQISLKNSVLKTTHHTYRDCRVHFFQQPFSKQLYKMTTAPNPAVL